MRFLRAMASLVLIFVIQAYRMLLSPLFGPACRFEPSCSVYAQEAIGRHGPARGVVMSARRIARCHPFHPGGFDPVPPLRDKPQASPSGIPIAKSTPI